MARVRARTDAESRPDLLTGAFVIAVLLHLLLFLVYEGLPERSSSASLMERTDQDEMLTFRFSDDGDVDTDADPLGDTPLSPTRQPPQPSLQPQKQETAPGEPSPVVIPDDITDQPTEQTTQDDPAPDPETETPPPTPEPQPETPPLEEPVDPLDTPDPQQETGEFEGSERSVPTSEAGEIPVPSTGAPPRTRRSLNESLREFGRTLRESGATRKPQGTNRTTFVPSAGDLPVQGSPYGILEFSSRDYDWSDYARQIYERILKAWYRRIEQSTNEFERWGRATRSYDVDDRTRINFTIQGDGDVTDIVVITASSCEPLDASATDALEEVLLPPLPPDFPRNSEDVKATFIMRVSVFELRQIFAYLRRIGYLD